CVPRLAPWDRLESSLTAIRVYLPRPPCAEVRLRRADYAGRVTLASVFPLVTARALARPFTYAVPEGTKIGAVVEARFGRQRLRGVVAELGVAAPAGIDVSEIERVVETVPGPLVELALWLAGYYGSTPARALALVAPESRKRRGERRQ